VAIQGASGPTSYRPMAARGADRQPVRCLGLERTNCLSQGPTNPHRMGLFDGLQGTPAVNHGVRENTGEQRVSYQRSSGSPKRQARAAGSSVLGRGSAREVRGRLARHVRLGSSHVLRLSGVLAFTVYCLPGQCA
jgi:hypothetical protein